MSELKFRAWSNEYDHYCSGLQYDSDFGWEGILESEFEYQTDPEPLVELYTGLKDKNGKEIYEGDIVEYTTCYYGNEKRHRKVIEWEEWDSDDFGEPHNLGYFDLSEGMEVIGNIHENPELLENKK